MSLCWRGTPRLVGIVEIRDLLALPDTSAVTGIARDPAPYRVSLEDDRGAAASQAIRAAFRSSPSATRKAGCWAPCQQSR
jgi:hypothetical protein